MKHKIHLSAASALIIALTLLFSSCGTKNTETGGETGVSDQVPETAMTDRADDTAETADAETHPAEPSIGELPPVEEFPEADLANPGAPVEETENTTQNDTVPPTDNTPSVDQPITDNKVPSDDAVPPVKDTPSSDETTADEEVPVPADTPSENDLPQIENIPPEDEAPTDTAQPEDLRPGEDVPEEADTEAPVPEVTEPEQEDDGAIVLPIIRF